MKLSYRCSALADGSTTADRLFQSVYRWTVGGSKLHLKQEYTPEMVDIPMN
jgi:hypothetical protein